MASQKQPISVGFFSLGCAKNLVDSQVMAGVLLSEDIVLAPSPETADVIIVNTCAFIEDARQESADSIEAACELKRVGSCRAVVVTGCYPQRYRQQVREQFPYVDAFVGLDGLETIADVVRCAAAGGSQGVGEGPVSAVRLYEPRIPGLALTGGPFAYLKIGEGCNHRCAFCAIPGIRGRQRSRPIRSIVSEAEALLDQGVAELVLISQDTTAYGHDLKDGSDLPTLLAALDGLAGRFWIRVLYGYPTGLTRELLCAMRDLEKVCHYLDVPVQHSHPEMLEAMQRGHTVDAVRNLAKNARAAMPDIALRTTCLVGYPGETDVHMEHLLHYLRENRFDHVGAFVFSPEEQTAAYLLPDRPDLETAESRRASLMLLQRDLVAEQQKARIGREAEVLLEAPIEESEHAWLARTRAQAPEVDGVVFVEQVPPETGPGTFVRVRYTEAADYDMIATFVERVSSRM